MFNEILGWAGAAALLAGLALASFDRTSGFKGAIAANNFMGGMFLAVSAFCVQNYSVAALNGVWCTVTLASIARRLFRPRAHRVATFAGPPGCGKTAVVQQVGKALALQGVSARCYYSGLTWRELATAMAQDGVQLAHEQECLAWWDEQRPSLSSSGALQMRTAKPQGCGLEGEIVGVLACTIAQHPKLRARVVAMMREFLARPGAAPLTLIDARDGVVLAKGLPAVHFYLDVPLEVRADRRAHQTGQDRHAVRAMMAAREAADIHFGRVTQSEARRTAGLVVLDGCRPLDVIVADVLVRLQIAQVPRQHD